MGNLEQQTSSLNGIGLGLRPLHYPCILQNKPALDWFEAVSENCMGTNQREGGFPLENLLQVRKDYPVALHGVSLSIGSVDPLSPLYLKKWKELIARVEPSLVSDHLCWTGAHGRNLHDLMPMPFTQESLAHLVDRVDFVQNYLGRAIALENVSSYIQFAHNEMTEWDFIAALSNKSGCGILLDINNIYVSSVNHGFDAMDFLRAMPAKSVWQIHLAGHSSQGELLIDTHDQPVPEPVWDLYKKYFAMNPFVPAMVERDDHIPPFEELKLEADRIKSYWPTLKTLEPKHELQSVSI